MKARVYYKSSCPFCMEALRILKRNNIKTEAFEVSDKPELREKVAASVGGYKTVPMIFIDNRFIGGCSELRLLEQQGKLG